MLAAGADGARVGTRFLAAAEADVHRVYREQLFSAGPDDTVVTSAYSVLWPPPDAPHRVLRTAVEAADRFTGDIVGEAEVGGQRLPLPKWAVAVPTTAFSGEVAAMALYAGQGVGAVERVQPAADIVEELVSGAEQLLARW